MSEEFKFDLNELEKELNRFMSMTPSKDNFFDLIKLLRKAESERDDALAKLAAIESQEPALRINSMGGGMQWNPNYSGDWSGVFYAKPVAADKPDLVQAIFDTSDRKAADKFKHCPKCDHKCDAQTVSVPDRIEELAERLVAPGPKCCALSASECHEISDFIRDLTPAESHSQQSVEVARCNSEK